MTASPAKAEPRPDEPGGMEPDDEIRTALLDAAAAVFAERGYDGTRIHDVVRRAGLSTGAVYGRFASKDDLLREAVITHAAPQARQLPDGATRVADLIERIVTRTTPELSEQEALLLEAYVSARRHPEIADAILEANRRWRQAVRPLADAAREDGSLAAGVDDQAVLFLVRVLRLGLLLHRASCLPEPDADTWSELVARVIASIGDPPVGPEHLLARHEAVPHDLPSDSLDSLATPTTSKEP